MPRTLSDTPPPAPREAILAAALAAFHALGYERATVAQIRAAAGVSNGSFFHQFASKEDLAAALYLGALDAYHAAMRAALATDPPASDGVRALLTCHLDWVSSHRALSQFLFEQVRSEWLGAVRAEQAERNRVFGEAIERWRAPLVASGALQPLPLAVFIGQLIGPAQLLCRAWLSGRSPEPPLTHLDSLCACAARALLAEPRTRTRSRRRTP